MEKKEKSYIGTALGGAGNLAEWLGVFGVGLFAFMLLYNLIGWWIIPILLVAGVGLRYAGKYLIYRKSVKDVAEDQKPEFSHFNAMFCPNLQSVAA
jgi:hypothetical protein